MSSSDDSDEEQQKKGAAQQKGKFWEGTSEVRSPFHPLFTWEGGREAGRGI